MATNKLMEAAADILAQSKTSAPAMPPQKLEGEVQDLGGPTNTNSKPLDDSNKLKLNYADHSAKNKASIATKPSAASAKMEDAEVEELESKLDEEIERGVEYKQALVESRKNEITRVVTEGLTDTQVEKIRTLAESVEFSTEDEYKSKLETIRENYFPSGVKKADEEQLHENVDDTEENQTINDPFVAAVSQAISKTKK